MTSYLIDKLEILKEKENKIKQEQHVLMEEIELEIKKKRRLELDDTIIKLRSQIDEIGKNIEGKIMRDNYPLLREQETYDYQMACNKFNKDYQQGLITDEEVVKQKKNIAEVKQKKDEKYQEWCTKDRNDPCSVSGMNHKITLDKFKDNLSKVNKKIRDGCHIRGNRLGMSYIVVPNEIKIYDNIIPIFTTILGIMKKQEYEINILKTKFKNFKNTSV